MLLLALGLCVTAVEHPTLAASDKLLSQDSACAVLKKRIVKLRVLSQSSPIANGWYCDFSTLGDERWYVIALRSNRKCEGICSNLLGWYAVDRSNGAVHEFDMADVKVGPALQAK